MDQMQRKLIAMIPHLKKCEYRGEEGYIVGDMHDLPERNAVRAFCPDCKVCCVASKIFLKGLV